MDHSLTDDSTIHASPANSSFIGTARKRPAPSGDSGVDGPRGKRGKYTAVACEICKRRKLKCVPTEDGSNCRRCLAGGLECVFALPPPPSATRERPQNSYQIRTLAEELSLLRQQVLDLTEMVNELKESSQRGSLGSPNSPAVVATSPSARAVRAPRQPQFIGPTRSAFDFQVGERSLTRMGIPIGDNAAPSGALSPVHSPKASASDAEFWIRCDVDEVVRLFDVFQDEVGSVYPFIDTTDLSSRAQNVLECLRSGRISGQNAASLDAYDLLISRVVIATAIIIEAHGKNELSNMIVDPVERNVSCILTPEVSLKEIQMIATLSIYYFVCDQDLLAWRTIGIAAREAMEMGLHHKKSLLDHFRDPESLKLATRVFWCVYVLDRRWSFGTSLSFALVDRDIDPELPEPGADSPYLQCMVGYGRLCSKLWDAIPPFGSATQSIPGDTAISLDTQAQDWLESIPSELQLRHPRLGLAPRSQPRALHRLRALLYLRGNHIRILIHRHVLLSRASIEADLQTAWLVVDIAQDSLQVLVHLNTTTDIYSRQQTAFNYFLLSALAVVFLAVCHAPKTFTESCRRSFHDAVELIRCFSRNSTGSRRLWHSIRGLLPALKRLEMQHEGDRAGETEIATPTRTLGLSSGDQTGLPEASHGTGYAHRHGHNDISLNGMEDMDSYTDPGSSVPDMFQMSNELITLFDVFGQGQPLPDGFNLDPYWTGEPNMVAGDANEISRRFQWLV